MKKCQVYGCDEDATRICSGSGLRYCKPHWHAHGNPPHRFQSIRTLGRSKNRKSREPRPA